MKKINILFVIIIVIIFNSCKQRFNKAVTFQKNYFTFTIDTPFVKSVYSNNKIITLKSDGKFICMNVNDYSLDTVTAKKINIKTAYGFYQIFDSLIIVCKDKDYYLTKDFNSISPFVVEIKVSPVKQHGFEPQSRSFVQNTPGSPEPEL